MLDCACQILVSLDFNAVYPYWGAHLPGDGEQTLILLLGNWVCQHRISSDNEGSESSIAPINHGANAVPALVSGLRRVIVGKWSCCTKLNLVSNRHVTIECMASSVRRLMLADKVGEPCAFSASHVQNGADSKGPPRGILVMKTVIIVK